jgi:coenzyme PQQ biosynthesis protein PqqD
VTLVREQEPMTPAELEANLREIGAERYHHRHPFHLLMHEGNLTRAQLQAWALNRYYYQSVIPMKDAIILSRSNDPAFRRAWRKRIIDHDGDGTDPGGIEKWIRLAQATGLDREQVTSERGILPAVRYAVNAYFDLVSKHSFLEAGALSMVERRLGLLRRPADAGAGRCEVRTRLGDRTCRHASRAGTGGECAARQVRHLVGPARRHVLCLRRAWLAASWRVSPGRRQTGMSELAPDSVLRLAPGCRLNAAGESEDLLLIPEGALRLKGPARAIVELCDGQRAMREIAEELKRRYSSADGVRIETEVAALLARLRDRGVLEAV